jgi:hypothetical protein
MTADLHQLAGSWTGLGATAGQQAWQPQLKLAQQAAEISEGVAHSLDTYAENSTRIVRAIIGVALELLEIYLICMALSAVSGYIADLVFATRAGLYISRLRDLFSALSSVIRSAAESLKQYGAFAAKLGEYTRVLLVDYVPDGIKEFPITLAATAVPAKLSGRDLRTGEAMLAMVPGIAQYGALNFVLGILEKENRLVRGFKSAIEGPAGPDGTLASMMRKLLHGDSSAGPAATQSAAGDSLPRDFRLTDPDPGPSLAEMLVRDDELPADVRDALAREFQVDREPAPPPSSSTTTDGTTSPAPAFTRKTDRELVYVFLKETLVNGLANILNGVESGNPHWLSDAAISAPLSGMRKVALERWFKATAYRGMPESATLDERMMSEMIVRTLAYALRNEARQAIQDAANGDPVVTQLTPYSPGA